MKAQCATKLRLHTSFILLVDGGMCSATCYMSTNDLPESKHDDDDDG